MRKARWILPVLLLLCLAYPAIVLGFYFLAPQENADLAHFDTLIVLGCPTDAAGHPTPEQRARVMEGVREFQRNVSRHIIMTGGPAHNRFVEAHAMALLAEQEGIPPEAVIEEGQAHDTIQNIYYSDKIMQGKHWHTAEVISSPYHLPRTALILEHYPDLRWHTHAAAWPSGYSLRKRFWLDWREASGYLRLRVHGFRKSRFLPQ